MADRVELDGHARRRLSALPGSDFEAVAALWMRVNRELAPSGMEALFEQYIATTIEAELSRLLDIFSLARRNAFWVVEPADGGRRIWARWHRVSQQRSGAVHRCAMARPRLGPAYVAGHHTQAGGRRAPGHYFDKYCSLVSSRRCTMMRPSQPRFAPGRIDRQRRKRPQWTGSDIHRIGGPHRSVVGPWPLEPSIASPRRPS
jgi:hypothetical protein